MKKIILLKSEVDHLGGLEKYTLRLAKAFSHAGTDVTLITSGAMESRAKVPEATFVKAPLKSLTSAARVLEFDRYCQKFLSENTADIIFGLDRNSIQTHIRAGNGCHAAYLDNRKAHEGLFKAATFAFNPLHRRLLALEKSSFQSPQLEVLFTNSAMVKEQILERYKLNKEKLCVIHNGVEWSEYASLFEQSLLERKNAIASLQLPMDCHHFLFAGHNFQRKGLDLLLNSLPLLSRIPYHLSVVGYDKKELHYKKKVKEMGLGGRVTFFGPRKDINTFYAAADTLVIPSIYDPFANVTLEALSMGLFVVTSPYNGAKEVLKTSAGIVVNNIFDRESFAQALMMAATCPKTAQQARICRESISQLDFSYQLTKIVDITLKKQPLLP